MAKTEFFPQKKSFYSANLTIVIYNRKLLIRLKIRKTDLQCKILNVLFP